ncbi:CCA tRNA nucleotidyltransferase [Pseudidiomarina aestuarii]|uniref:CCA tRNA nucleotidyltransferase n=1 Tax=Pseudidiomarina aestuarii TaxID=624146 RepID=UPI003A96F53A
MKTYLVGGAVRDQLLGLPVVDRDYVVVGATPAAMLAAGYQQVGKDFPVFLHPRTQAEYALARTERKQGQGYTGFSVNADPTVTLEEDLLRRDLTINAMAETAQGEIIDPYGGQQDIEQRLLRHVSPAFTEDPLRVLRVARFNARFHELGFTIAPDTKALLKEIAVRGELTTISAERVWRETELALSSSSPAVYFEVLNEVHALTPWFAELGDVIDSALERLRRCSAVINDSQIRCAALFSVLSEVAGKTICARLKTPNRVQQLTRAAIQTASFWDKQWSPDSILEVISKIDGWRQPERVEAMLPIWSAQGMTSTYVSTIQDCFAAAREVSIQSLSQETNVDQLQGPAIGAAIQAARLAAIQVAF